MASCSAPTPNCWLRAAGLLACCAFLLPVGCGPNYKARAVVRGKVTTGGKHLTTGTVMFYGKDGVTGSATIDPDGNYEMRDAPLGECKVTVTVPDLPMDPSVRARLEGKGGGPKLPEGPKPPPGAEMPGGPPPPAARVPKEVIPVDPKYSDPNTSGLNFTVKKGEQTYDIDL